MNWVFIINNGQSRQGYSPMIVNYLKIGTYAKMIHGLNEDGDVFVDGISDFSGNELRQYIDVRSYIPADGESLN